MDGRVCFVLIFFIEATLQEPIYRTAKTVEDNKSTRNSSQERLEINSVDPEHINTLAEEVDDAPEDRDNTFKYEITENNPENATFNFTNILSPSELKNETASTTEPTHTSVGEAKSTSTPISSTKEPTASTNIDLQPFTNPKYLSILHIKFESEDKTSKPPEVNPIQPVNPNFNVLNFLAENAFNYIDGVKKGVSSGISNAFGNINYQPYINRVISLPNLAAGPVLVFNKIHRTTVEAASKIHDALFRHTVRH